MWVYSDAVRIEFFFKRYFQCAVLRYHRTLRYAVFHPFG